MIIVAILYVLTDPRIVFHDYPSRAETCIELAKEATIDYKDTQWRDFNWYDSCMKQWKTSPLLEID